jgi:hypothetical protein
LSPSQRDSKAAAYAKELAKFAAADRQIDPAYPVTRKPSKRKIVAPHFRESSPFAESPADRLHHATRGSPRVIESSSQYHTTVTVTSLRSVPI